MNFNPKLSPSIIQKNNSLFQFSDNGFHKLIDIEETVKKPLNQNGRVKRNFGLFCRNRHISMCKEYYSQILEIGKMGNQIDEEPLKRHGIGKVDSSRREKLNNMLLKIRSWQQNKLMELQLCFECEKYNRSYKVNRAPYISSNFYDIPIPVPLNFRPNPQDLFYH